MNQGCCHSVGPRKNRFITSDRDDGCRLFHRHGAFKATGNKWIRGCFHSVGPLWSCRFITLDRDDGCRLFHRRGAFKVTGNKWIRGCCHSVGPRNPWQRRHIRSRITMFFLSKEGVVRNKDYPIPASWKRIFLFVTERRTKPLCISKFLSVERWLATPSENLYSAMNIIN